MIKIFPLAVALAVLAVAGPAAVEFVTGNLTPLADATAAAMQEVKP